jgi:hypothetical protein
MAVPPTDFVRCVQTVRPRTSRRDHTVRGAGHAWFLRRRRSTHSVYDRDVAQQQRTACDASHPSFTSHTSLFVGGARTGRALAPAPSSSDSLSSLGQRTHRRALAANSKLSTSDSVTSLRACLVKDSSTCGQCMLVTSAQGADLRSIAVYRTRPEVELCDSV